MKVHSILPDNDAAGDTQSSALRVLLILEEVAKVGVPVTPTFINQKLGLPKTTIHRLFSELEVEGFLQREIDGRSYTPGPRFRALSMEVLSSVQTRTARLAILNALADEIGETCNISFPEKDGMLYLERVETKWPLRIQLAIGSRVPFYCTASGKLYLSTLSRSQLDRYIETADLTVRTRQTIVQPDLLRQEITKVRKSGFAQDNEEFMDGMIAIAVPIKAESGRMVSTLSFHAPSQRLTIEQANLHVMILEKAAADLSGLMVVG